jgi:hypothetical protein
LTIPPKLALAFFLESKSTIPAMIDLSNELSQKLGALFEWFANHSSMYESENPLVRTPTLK